MRSHKTIYVHFDLNDYSIPPGSRRAPADAGGFRHPGDSVNSAEYSPDGGRVVTASSDRTARIPDE